MHAVRDDLPRYRLRGAVGQVVAVADRRPREVAVGRLVLDEPGVALLEDVDDDSVAGIVGAAAAAGSQGDGGEQQEGERGAPHQVGLRIRRT